MTTDETMTPTAPHEPEAPANEAGQAPDKTDMAMPSDASAPAAPSEEPTTPIATAPAPTPRPVKASKEDDMNLFDAAMREMDSSEGTDDSTFKKLSKGDRVEATVIQVDRDRVFVDLGTKSEGIVPLSELSEDNLETAHGHLAVGDKIQVVVLKTETGDGNPIVSKKRADFEEAWDRIERAHRSGEMITAQVVDRVKGGLVVDIGVRGFVPATHVGSGKLRNIEKFVGNPLQLKVIEIDRERKKVVLSNREAEEQRRSRAKEEIFETVKVGEIVDGTVRRLTDYGAFIDLGGVDGLLHISEMSWARINHPKEMFKEGQKIKVMVLRLDSGAGKISLGHRQVLPDPWNLIRQNYKVQQVLKVTIGRIVQSGAFIKLPEGAEAFLPVSEMSARRIKRPQEVVEENTEVEVQIIDLRPDERRMVLSMKAIGGGGGGDSEVGYQRREMGGPPPSYGDDFRGGGDRGRGGPGAKGKKGGKRGASGSGGGRGGRDVEDDFEDVGGRRGFATGGATIGERLGALRGLLGRDEDVEDETVEVNAETDATPEEVAAVIEAAATNEATETPVPEESPAEE
jgi:predicted RNA-binding protein with RPS1 domain